ncbi:ABC transporter permease subunit [Pseudobacter ginsenosidimutans]|uniref:ABC-2 type transport system permease protein n=1 Tax=Pseudobacter ginsenosidimutans TaxID=661488 RepID=A0A4Q7MZV1_9BACT|nr:Gldg family protein [Pseudobacter ginsenosidimutans]QEC43147.1 ABC transporter permease subunit [Pseudobacter ginsenosidimutans]RZS74503.1 ABC-2 type transport system permease protein [Pseudobacter ginsenosidimutans]
MKIIFKIARAELRTLFYSPIAWIVIVTFFVICGMEFVTPLMDMARQQQIKAQNSPMWEGFEGPLTFRLFEETINKVLSYFYLFIPLLTMGTISREVNAGTMYLLGSSPVRTREIVLGKYLGLLTFNFTLLLAIALLLGTGYFTIVQADLSWFLSMMLGFFLLSAAYLAIGLYISCLTNYQIMAGIATFVVFTLLTVIGWVWQEYDFVRDLTWFLSISGRTEKMIGGLITTRDLAYFILIILLFLGLAMLRLRSKQESVKWTVPFSRNLAWVLGIVMLGYFTSRPGYVGYLDVTRDKWNTIDTATQSVLKELDGSPVTVTAYVNLFGGNLQAGIPESRNEYIWGFWDKYMRFYPNLKFKYEYFYDVVNGDSGIFQAFPNKNIDQIAVQVAKIFDQDLSKYQKPDGIRKKIDLSKEPLRMVMELDYKGKKTILRTFTPKVWPDEPNVSASVRRLTRDSLPGALFLTGHYERSPWRNGEREFGTHTNYDNARPGLANTGVNSDTISLLQNDIPASTALLVVADPKSSLAVTEQEKILRYLGEGGNALFYAEPGKQQMLNPLLNQLGVNIDPGILVSPRKHVESGVFDSKMTAAGNHMAREKSMQKFRQTGKNGAIARFKGSSHISYQEKDGFTIEPIVTLPGDKNIWIENGLFVSDSAAPIFAAAEGDIQKEEYVLAIKLERKINNKLQRIVITGDADFMSRVAFSGMKIGTGIYSWLVNNEYPIYTRVVDIQDRKLTIGKNTGKTIWYAYVYVIPGLLLITGTLLIIRRKRK